MNKNLSKKPVNPFHSLKTAGWLIFIAALGIWPGCKKGVTPSALERSPAGKLSRYDLTANAYDVLPVTTFTLSYNSGGKITNLFQKSGQTLLSFNLSYSGDKLTGAVANNLGLQSVTYNADGKPMRVDYTTITDTGKLVYNYNAAGKLTGVLDSVKKPLNLPLRYRYTYIYDAGGNNVVQIIKNQLDLQGRPTLKQYSFYTFDDKQNPFTAFPYLQSSGLLPGDVPALVNKNNVVGTHLVGTIPNTATGGSVPTLDTITIYRASRSYEYNTQGFPSKASEQFNDIQFNYSGKRTFTYEY